MLNTNKNQSPKNKIFYLKKRELKQKKNYKQTEKNSTKKKEKDAKNLQD